MAAPIVAEHDPIADSIALERVAAELQNQISPLVAIESLGKRLRAGQVMQEPDTLFCDLSGVTHLFDNEAGILEATHRCLGEFGLVGKLAIADNAAAAWAQAHYNTANDFVSIRGIDDLQSLSVNALRIESEIKYTLDRLGIQTIGALLKLPRSGLARRLGDGLVQRIAEVLGEIEVPLEAYHAQQHFHSNHDLEYPTDDLEIVADRVSGLTEAIVAQLQKSQRGALRIACRLDLVDRPPITTVIGLFAPTLDPKHLCCLINSSIESRKVPGPIAKIALSVVQSGPLRTQQKSLFADGLFADGSFAMENGSVSEQSLARLVDALSGRLGRDAVLGIRLADNPLPEQAYRTYSLTDHRTRKALRRLPSKQRKPVVKGRSTDHRFNRDAVFRPPGRYDARRRPMKLLRKPVRLTVVSDQASHATDADQRLPCFQVDGRVIKVNYYWGPERIETGWWDGPSVRRDYYRIETDGGNLWWVFRDLRGGGWFLHGRFA